MTAGHGAILASANNWVSSSAGTDVEPAKSDREDIEVMIEVIKKFFMRVILTF